jgi:hypothetical protein
VSRWLRHRLGWNEWTNDPLGSLLIAPLPFLFRNLAQKKRKMNNDLWKKEQRVGSLEILVERLTNKNISRALLQDLVRGATSLPKMLVYCCLDV